MADISSAQAVLLSQARLRCLHEWGSVNDPPCHPSDPGWKGCSTCAYKPGLAAAIEELADQVAPEEVTPWNSIITDSVTAKIRSEMLAIAARLKEGHPPDPEPTASTAVAMAIGDALI